VKKIESLKIQILVNFRAFIFRKFRDIVESTLPSIFTCVNIVALESLKLESIISAFMLQSGEDFSNHLMEGSVNGLVH